MNLGFYEYLCVERRRGGVGGKQVDYRFGVKVVQLFVIVNIGGGQVWGWGNDEFEEVKGEVLEIRIWSWEEDLGQSWQLLEYRWVIDIKGVYKSIQKEKKEVLSIYFYFLQEYEVLLRRW